VGSYPECEGYVGPIPWEDAPKFLFKVWDHFAEIDEETFVVKLNDTYIFFDDEESDLWSIDYDDVTGYLGIWIDYEGYVDWSWRYGQHWPPMPPMVCGSNELYVGVSNVQHNYASLTVDIEVDCDPPTVVFDNRYVTKDPTIEFYLTDIGSGLDLNTVFVDVIAVQQQNIDPNNPNQNEHLFFLGTFYPDQIKHYMVNDTTVRITTSYDLPNKRAIFVAIYDGTRDWYWDDYYYYGGDPLSYDDWDEFYAAGHGVHDCVGNAADPWFQELTVDLAGPMVLAEGEDEFTELDHLPVTCSNIMITDGGSGIDADAIQIYEDGELVYAGEGEGYSYNPSTGMLHYCPTSGAKVELFVYDNAGNQTYRMWKANGGVPTDYGEAINYPNPFDPSSSDKGCTTIETKFDGDEVMVTIYDFAGNEVWSGVTDDNGVVNWCGTSSDGERVANGVYFAYCKSPDGRHKVVKIAVIER
jgi:hypothetical protein